MYRGFGYGYQMPGAGLWMGVLGFLFVVGVILLVLLLLRASRGGHHGMMQMHGGQPMSPAGTAPRAGHDEAVAIAKRRLAVGEVTPEQYGEIMKALGE